MRLDPKALRLFLAVCREGTISGAARSEHLSQPSVSVAIGNLEHVLGTRLFDRHRQGIQLTPAGEALKRRAQAIDNLISTAQREVGLLQQDLLGPLVIGGTPGALATFIPQVLTPLMEKFPRFELRILERPDHELQELLRQYDIDLAVVTAGINESPADLEEQVVMSDTFAVIAGEQNTDIPDTVSLPELGEHSWVLPDAVGGFRRQVDALFVNAEAPTPANVIRCDSLLTTKSIVRNTRYITILPREVAMPELNTGALRAINIKEAGFQRHVGLVWLKERQFTGLAQAFIELAQQNNAE